MTRYTASILMLSFLVVGACGGDAGSPDTTDTTDTRDTGDTTDAGDTDDSGDTVDPGDSGDVTTTCDPVPADPTFDDHTVLRLGTLACFDLWAGDTEEPRTVKFVIVDVSAVLPEAAASADLRFMQTGFYTLHDEWYWFRLLNGHPIPGRTTPTPIPGSSFESIASVYEAFADTTTLPLDLTRAGAGGPFPGRIYSSEFYRLAGLVSTSSQPPERPPFFGIGTVLHFQPNAERRFPGEIWGFELEYSHTPTVADIVRYFLMLEAKLPPEVRGRLRWIARSPAQRTIAATLKSSGHPFGPRTLTYDDLVVSGQVEVYNEGIAAGIAEVFPLAFSPSDVRANHLAVIPLVPDDIPPSRAIVSAVPQTALAHVNLLAKARGTPNAHVAGILESARIRDWSYLSTPLIFEAKADSVRWQPITTTEYNEYLTLLAPPERHVPQVDLTNAPLTVPLSGPITEMASLVPLVGGKAAGFQSFVGLSDMATPDLPLGITIRPFREHLADLEPLIRDALAEVDFVTDSRVRFLTLEGEDNYRDANANNPAALALVTDIATRHADGPLGEVLTRGGIKRLVTDKSLNYDTLRALRDVLVGHFAFLAPTQGIRFRSSSTAEDVPGFNGAGLYVSNTGFLFPSLLSDPNERRKTIEWAIKETWSSYWGFQAFEERRVGRVDHFEGAMGIAVHARFDDAKERANAVMTSWWSDYPETFSRRLVINVQKGALAVTNPGGTSERPEIDEVILAPNATTPTISRIQRSSLSTDEEPWLFTDAELLNLFDRAMAHTERWLLTSTSTLTNPERPRTIVLDYEIKAVTEGWPALTSGEVRPARLIWRQARVLDQVDQLARPSANNDPYTPGFALATFMPRDIRTVAQKVVTERCTNSWGDFRVYAVYTEPAQRDLFPFAETPLMYRAWVDFSSAPPGLDADLLGRVIPWTSLPERVFAPTGTHRVKLDTGTSQLLRIDGFELTPPNGETSGFVRVWKGDVSQTASCTSYSPRSPFQSAGDFLRTLLLATTP